MQSPYDACVANHIKYEGSTAVLAALARLVEDNPSLGTVFGVTRDIGTSAGIIAPDVSVKSTNLAGAVFFELKWTLTSSTAPTEILNLKRYLEAQFNWGGPQVGTADVVLVVNEEDASLTVAAADALVTSGNTFLTRGLAIWKWHYSTGRDIHGEPSIWFEKIWGTSTNQELERLISSPSGYQTPPEILRYIRWTYRFTKDKPPVQYTIGALLMHVFSSFRTRTDVKETLRISATLTDTVYERAKGFFPNRDPSNDTIQVRKQWIREALSMMGRIRMEEIRVPIQTRVQLPEYICRRIRALLARRTRHPRSVGRKGMRRIRRPRKSPLDTTLM